MTIVEKTIKIVNMECTRPHTNLDELRHIGRELLEVGLHVIFENESAQGSRRFIWQKQKGVKTKKTYGESGGMNKM